MVRKRIAGRRTGEPSRAKGGPEADFRHILRGMPSPPDLPDEQVTLRLFRRIGQRDEEAWTALERALDRLGGEAEEVVVLRKL